MKTNEKKVNYIAPVDKTIVIKMRKVLCGNSRTLYVDNPFDLGDEQEEVM